MAISGRLFHRRTLPAVLQGGLFVAGLICSAQTEVRRKAPPEPPKLGNVDWSVNRGDPKGNQFAALAQINATNVHKLRRAWEFHTGDASARSSMYANPIVINGVMYISTPSLKAIAINAATGAHIWSFDPAVYNNGRVIRLRNRGVTYWKGAEGERIFDFVGDRMYAIDAKTGELIRSFGRGGYVDLRENLGVDPAGVTLEMTTPGAVYKNLVILGSRVNESYGASPGHIRAYDAVTGRLKWIFHTIPQPGEFGHETWEWPTGETFGGANAWGGVTIDEQRGWAFVATGSATDDFYGGFRKGRDLFANCVIALDANTGERKWHYQTVHHDLWDYDNPPAPILVDIRNGNKTRAAVVQLTKMGLLFLLDRDTGQPIFPVTEVPVPPSDVPGEQAWPTQPIPVKPQPLVRQAITEADLTNITPEAHEYALELFRRYRSGSIYTPTSLQGNIVMPSHLGGAEWHGGSFDPLLNILYVNVNEIPTIDRLRPVYGDGSLAERRGAPDAKSEVELGRQIYETNCMACHGSDRKGDPPRVPPLLNLDLRRPEFQAVITGGRDIMPAFKQFKPPELAALAAYVGSPQTAEPAGNPAARRYTIDGYPQFTDAQGFPAIAPPWGTLNAINLATGDILWKVPLGEYPALAAKGIHNTGTMNFGGAVATSGGVLFIAATADEKIRAFETYSGRVLWESQLPAGGYATPSIYMVNGKEYVAIAAGGGGKNATKSGDSIVAFALPDEPADSPPAAPTETAARHGGWIQLFDGKTLDGWVHMNGVHTFDVEDGAIVGRTVEGSANSFLCTTREFDDFELELETYIDPITNSGVQIRTKVRPITVPGPIAIGGAGRINGPQVEIRRTYKGLPATGMLYGEALDTGWFTSDEKIAQGNPFNVADGWNRLRIVARGPRIQTWVNDHQIENLTLDELYRNYKKGVIGLQIHGISEREIALPVHAGLHITTHQPLMVKFRNIRLRQLR